MAKRTPDAARVSALITALAFLSYGFIPQFGGPGYKAALGAGLVLPAVTAISVALPAMIPAWHAGAEWDMLVTAGERKSMALLTMALHDFDCAAESFTGSQAGIVTDTAHTKARILEIKPERIDLAH